MPDGEEVDYAEREVSFPEGFRQQEICSLDQRFMKLLEAKSATFNFWS